MIFTLKVRLACIKGTPCGQYDCGLLFTSDKHELKQKTKQTNTCSAQHIKHRHEGHRQKTTSISYDKIKKEIIFALCLKNSEEKLSFAILVMLMSLV